MSASPTSFDVKETPFSNSQARPLIKSVIPTNILSFGADGEAIPLSQLNILIGANGSGKSNLIDVISLLRSSPSDLQKTIREGGGVEQWIWKGEPKDRAIIEFVINNMQSGHDIAHSISFYNEAQEFRLEQEYIVYPFVFTGQPQNPYVQDPNIEFRYANLNGNLVIKLGRGKESIVIDWVDSRKSILSQWRDPKNLPELFFLSSFYEKIRIYREWSFGRHAIFREPQRADMPNYPLNEDFSNLGLYLNHLRQFPKTKNKILSHLKDIYDGVDDFDVRVLGGSVQVFLTEGEFTIPATRLSDGTLRYLCLLAILCDPDPPPLICIEEPELGLHPDLIPKIADLLIEASERTQLIVTTHSDILIDEMEPESVLVCEKHEGQTQIKRLDAEKLKTWLEDYRLGQLWLKGGIGGTRW